jgi:hypothetical protein
VIFISNKIDLIKLTEDVEKILTDFNNFFIKSPELFLDELEIRNTLYRNLQEKLVLNGSYKNIDVEREYKLKPIMKRFDLAISINEEILFAFEIKYTYSGLTALKKKILIDIERLTKYAGSKCIKRYVFYYDNFENYPKKALNELKTDVSSPLIDFRIITTTPDKLKMMQDDYMGEYDPTYPVK